MKQAEFYAEALRQITKAPSLQEAKVIAWTVLKPIPESLKEIA